MTDPAVDANRCLPERVRRLAVTVLGCGAYAAAEHIPLPLFELPAWLQPLPAGLHPPGVLDVGVNPLLSAAVCVELAALLVPRWRPLRLGGHEARGRLWRATAVVALVLALMQTFFIARWMAATGGMERTVGMYLFTMLTLTGGAALAAVAALALGRFGLGNGFSALLGLGALQELIAGLREQPPLMLPDSPELLRMALPVFILGGAALWALRRRQSTAVPGSAIPWPASGLLPLSLALVLPQQVDNVVRQFSGSPGGARLLVPGAATTVVVQISVLLVATAAWTWAFNGPRRLAQVGERLGAEGSASPRGAAALAALMLLAAGGLQMLLDLVAPAVSVLLLAVLAAVGADLVAEWRARANGPLVSVWPMHCPYAVDAVLVSLRRAGIAAHAAGLRHRALMQFFGPYVPIQILVAPDRAAEAEAIVTRFVPPTPPPPAGHSDDDEDTGP